MAFVSFRAFLITCSTLCILLIAATLRLLLILPPSRAPPRRRFRNSPTHLLVVLGSGGHTTEMLALLRELDAHSYNYRTYVVSEGDAFSAERAREFEEKLDKQEKRTHCDNRESKIEGNTGTVTAKPAQHSNSVMAGHIVGPGSYRIVSVPRARRIHQSLLTTPFSAIQCLISCICLLSFPLETQRGYPDLILTNGPGTACILILASIVLRFFDFKGAHSRGCMRSIYVESWARVKRLSLTGRLVVKVVDRFLVQWRDLEGVAGRGEFRGVLV